MKTPKFVRFRFGFSLKRHRFIMRGGIFGLEIYWGALYPVWNNVSVDEKRWGVIFYPIFRIVPGASFRCFRWLKVETMDAVEDGR